MNIFIERVDRGIWKVVKQGLFVPTHDVDGVVANKPEKGLDQR